MKNLRTRRTIRRYSDRPVDDGKLHPRRQSLRHGTNGSVSTSIARYQKLSATNQPNCSVRLTYHTLLFAHRFWRPFDRLPTMFGPCLLFLYKSSYPQFIMFLQVVWIEKNQPEIKEVHRCGHFWDAFEPLPCLFHNISYSAKGRRPSNW